VTAISPSRNQKNILKKMSQSTCENGIEIIQLWIARMWTARSSEFSVTSTNIYFRKLSVCLCEKRKDNLHSGKNKEPKNWIDSTDTKARGSASTLRAWKSSHNLREREREFCVRYFVGNVFDPLQLGQLDDKSIWIWNWVHIVTVWLAKA
jgi:hypothetical protein